LVEQVTTDGLDAMGLQLALHIRIGKSSDADNASLDASPIRRATCHAGQRWPHFAGDPEYEKITAYSRQRFDGLVGRLAKKCLQLGNVFNAFASAE
jgi:hypothetical protein